MVYNSCKSGVIGFTRNLAHEVAPRGVNVFCVAPGIMIKERDEAVPARSADPRQQAGRGAIIEAITHQVQLGRASLPEEAANMVAYLASEAAELHVRPDHRRGRRTVDGLNMASLNDIQDAAIAQTGLDDFGDDSYREGLEILLTSLRDEARLNDRGGGFIYQRIIGYLGQRLQVEDWYRRHPEIDDVRIDRAADRTGAAADGFDRAVDAARSGS